MSPQYKLTYFNGRGRGEFIRLLFAAAKIPFEDEIVDWQKWAEVKANYPMGQLPNLHVDGKLLMQSETIGRYLSKEFGFHGKDNWESAQIEQYVDGVTDMQNALQAAELKVNQDTYLEDFKPIIKKEFVDPKFKPWAAEYTKFLQSNPSGWFVGDKPTFADIRVAEFVERIDEIFQPGLIDEFPVLKAHMKRVNSIPGIAERVASRPKNPYF